MNSYRKYCANVYVAACENQHEKGESIVVTTKHGKAHECVVHNYLGQAHDGMYLYSITREDGYNNQERAARKSERLKRWAERASQKSDEYMRKSEKHKDFLSLMEPIKIGHHSEKRHRRIIKEAWDNVGKAVQHDKKSNAYLEKVAYWEKLSTKIDLSMPESLDYFEYELEKAIDHHKGLKDGTIPKEHSYSLAYANKRVKEMQEKLNMATKLWS